MNCPNCNLEISEVDKICPFCEYTIFVDEAIETSENSIETIDDTALNEHQQSTENFDHVIQQNYDEQALDIEHSDNDESSIFTEISPINDAFFEEESKAISDTESSVLNTDDINLNADVEQEPKATEQSNTDSQSTSSTDEHNVSLIEKLLMVMSNTKKLDAIPIKSSFPKKSRIQNIIASIPFLFWYPYALKKKTKTMTFFANQSLKLTLYLMLNSIALLFFELMPFYKTVTYLNDGILYYSSVKYIPLVILIPLSVSFLIWLLLTFLNIYCSVKNKPYNFLPFKHFSIIK